MLIYSNKREKEASKEAYDRKSDNYKNTGQKIGRDSSVVKYAKILGGVGVGSHRTPLGHLSVKETGHYFVWSYI